MAWRKILFPIDFSDAALAMVPHVTEMAHRFQAAVTVLNAFELAPSYVVAPRLEGGYDLEPATIPYTPAFQDLRKQRELRLEEFSRVQFPSLLPSVRIEDGDPAMVIHWVAQHENTDLIMMPTKGHGRFRRWLLGSVTAKVLHDVDCSVLTSVHDHETAEASPGGFHSILCAVEMNQEADAVLKAAGHLAQVYGARICLLNIEPPLHQHHRAAAAQSVQNAFEKALNSSGQAAVETRVRILDGTIPDSIRRTAVEEKADLVVVGRGHQQGHLSRMWSHLYAIIRESPCPVLSVPAATAHAPAPPAVSPS